MLVCPCIVHMLYKLYSRGWTEERRRQCEFKTWSRQVLLYALRIIMLSAQAALNHEYEVCIYFVCNAPLGLAHCLVEVGNKKKTRQNKIK